MSKSEKDKKLEFYETLRAAFLHASEDLKREPADFPHYLVDTCFIIPAALGFKPGLRPYVEEFYDGDASTDLLGYAIFEQLKSLPPKSLQLIVHPLNAIEFIHHVAHKIDAYQILAKEPVLTNGDDISLLHGDTIVGKFDTLFRQYTLYNSFPGLQTVLDLFRCGSMIGLADCFREDLVLAARRQTITAMPEVERAMELNRQPLDGRHGTQVGNLRYRVDSGVILDTAALNRTSQLGLLTHTFSKSAVVTPENWAILRSAYSFLAHTYARKRLSPTINPNYKKGIAFAMEADISILLGRVTLIVDKLTEHLSLVDDIRSLPRPIKEELAEFEMTKLKEVLALPPPRIEEANSKNSMGVKNLQDQFRDASTSLEEKANEFLELYPELLGDRVLSDYGIKDHPRIVALLRRFNP